MLEINTQVFELSPTQGPEARLFFFRRVPHFRTNLSIVDCIYFLIKCSGFFIG